MNEKNSMQKYEYSGYKSKSRESLHSGDQILRISDKQWYEIKYISLSTNQDQDYRNHPLLHFTGFCILSKNLHRHFEIDIDRKFIVKEI